MVATHVGAIIVLFTQNRKSVFLDRTISLYLFKLYQHILRDELFCASIRSRLRFMVFPATFNRSDM